ncbi:hypothetical protein BDV23DRAFT_114190 [Aspergillus alliaceus]|uniref:Chromo domain-containing protein n=1 Tax=Petromyces alliaceus TaxID=209559 RepID=A0A5N7C2I0_PETAA|nr:hypothetical protein BDV23DRAFT_114190 [Aspergillus alliaceus]
MVMADASDDDVSLTSTVPSPPKENYFVDTIHAERETSRGVEYLVGWEDYPIERCTWETAAQFDNEQTILDWKAKKREIEAGRLPAFDLAVFDRRLRQVEEAYQKRKKKRQAKRNKLTEKKLEESDTDFSIGPKGFGDAEVEPMTSCRARVSDVYPNSATDSSQAAPPPPRLSRWGPARPPLVGFGTGPGGLIRSRPRKSFLADSSAPPKMFKNLSIKNRCEKARAYEPAPDISQLELIRPSEWPSTSAAHSAKPASQNLTSLNAQKTGGSPKRRSGDASAIDTFSSQPQNSFVDDSHSPKRTPSDTNRSHRVPDFPEGSVLPRREPGSRAIFIKGPYFVNPGELLITMYYGPDRKEIGEARLCGLDNIRRNRFMRTKKGNRLEIWFQHLCNLADYNTLCKQTYNEKYLNSWIEGFDDSEPNIYKFGEELRRRNLVAIHTPAVKSHDVLLVYPPNSEDFWFLSGCFKGPPRVFLHTAVRSPFGPLQQSVLGNSKGQHGHLTGANTVTYHPSPSNTVLANKQASETLCERIYQNQDNRFPVVESPKTFTAPELDSETNTAPPQTSVSNLRDSMSTARRILPGIDSMDIDQPPMTAASSNNMQPPPTMQAFNLDSYFEEKFGMTFHTLVSAPKQGGLSGSGSFCVLFPQEPGASEEECQLVVEFLKAQSSDRYRAIIYSNRTPEDWEKFTQAKTGVILIHENFLDYYKLRSLNKLYMQPAFSFWSFSLSRESGDNQPHFRRMFPIGGVALITEEYMSHDPRGTVLILSWFLDFAKSKRPGTWKLMFRPDILNWLQKQIDTAENSRYLWLAMYQFMMQIIALADAKSREILTGAESGYTQNPVISPSKLPLYGSRTEQDNPEVPRGLTQVQRNADHLIEFFAGWALVNCHQYRKFYVFTSVGPYQRWDEWQHLDIRVDTTAIMKCLSIDPKSSWGKLKESLSETRSQTPFTPQTPKASSSSESAASWVTHSCSPPPKHRYPQPYQ